MRELRPSWRGWVVRGAAFGIACGAWLGIGGCPQTGDLSAPDTSSTPRAKLASGQFDDAVLPGRIAVYEIDVPAGQTFDLIARTFVGASVELVWVELPDGTILTGSEATSTAKAVDAYQLENIPDSEGGAALRLEGTGDSSGSWRFGLRAVRSAEFADFERAFKQRSTLEQGFALLYLLGQFQGSSGNSGAQSLAHLAFPELAAAERALEIELVVRLANVGQLPPPPANAGNDATQPSVPLDDITDSTDNANDNSNDGGSNDNTNSGDNNSNDNSSSNDNNNTNSGSNDNSGGNQNTNTNTNDNGGDNPPPVPTQVELTPIAQTGDAVPGQQSGARFVYFGNPTIDSEGRIAFWAKFSGGQGDGGLFVYQNGALQKVVDDNQATHNVPSGAATDYFGDLNILWDSGVPALNWGGGARLLFLSPITRSPYPVGIYRWRATDSDMVRVANIPLMADQFTNDLPNTFASEFFYPGVSDTGIALFATRYTYITTQRQFVTGRTGVYSSNGATLTRIVDVTRSPAGSVPGQGGDVSWDSIDGKTTVNAAGDMIFQAASDAADGDRGVYLVHDGSVFRVIDNATNRSWPGLTFGTTIGAAGTAFDAIALSPSGHFAIDTTLTRSGETRDAVILWTGTQWRELTGGGNAASSTLLSGVNAAGHVAFLADNLPYLHDGSTSRNVAAALPAQLANGVIRWEPVPGSINNHDRVLLRFSRLDASDNVVSGGLALWTGEALILVADAFSTLPDSQWTDVFHLTRPELDRVGRSGMMNDRDEIVFRVGSRGADNQINTADDRQAIYLGAGRP
ncbi:MAG: hypothetical protein JNG88_05990 [Phycisphaerales bacterium]|nr:hypothetical protein [Phycisphaerales bacterium]